MEIDPLENRRLMSAAVISAITPVLADTAEPASNSISLPSFIGDSNVPGTVVEIKTTEGTIDVALTDAATPITVANFLSYVNSGAYDYTFFHRSAVLSSNTGGSPSTPADIVQGGGYILNRTNPALAAIQHIVTAAPIDNEVSTETEGNVAGTIAMAKTSDPNSATSEFYFNVNTNTDLDDTSDSGGFTTFGHVISGMNVVDAIAALPTVELNSSLTTVPVSGISEADATDSSTQIRPSNLVYILSTAAVPGSTYTASSSNPALVNSSINGSELSFSYGAGSGTALISVSLKSFDGSTATESFTVTVPGSSTSTGPVANADTITNVPAGTQTTLHVLNNDTDSSAALNPATVTITTRPAHGTATVDSTTGDILYTPTSGYTGSDTLSYTVGDENARTSSAAEVHLTVTAAPATTTIGTRTQKSLRLIQPSGVVANITVSNGTATFTFAGSTVTSSTSGGVVVVQGTNATISDITITNTTGKKASLTISSAGSVAIANITDSDSMLTLSGPTVALTGALDVGGVSLLRLASATGASLQIGSGSGATNLYIGTVSDTSVHADGSLGTVRSTQWTSSTTTLPTLAAQGIASLVITKNFAENLVLSGASVALGSAQIGGELASGSWNLVGPAGSIVAGTVNPAWALSVQGSVKSLQFGGNYSGSIAAASLTTLHVGGDLQQASIVTIGVAHTGLQIGNLTVGGSITNSIISTNGDVGTISAADISGSSILAAISNNNGSFPTSSSDFSTFATINAVKVGAGGTFSNTRISAGAIDSAQLGIIQTSNSGITFGLAAEDYKSIQGKLSTGKTLALGRAQLTDSTVLSTYLTKKDITLGDFAVNFISA